MLAFALAVALELPGPLGHSDFGNAWLRDNFIRWRVSSVEDQRVLVVDIDEASLTALGPWPWPRKRLADLVESLLQANARGVALDLVLPEKSDSGGDQRLAMLAQYGPLVLGQALTYTVRTPPLRVGHLASGGSWPASSDAGVAAQGYIANQVGFARAQQVGNIGFLPDQDGMLRRIPLQSAFDGRVYPSLSLALFNCCAEQHGPDEAAGFALRARDHDFLALHFARSWASYTVVSALSVLQHQADIPISGRLVLVGSSALGLSDMVPTALSATTAGVMVHASALTELLDDSARAHKIAWPGRIFGVLFAALASLLATLAFPRLSAIASLSLLAATALLWVIIAFWLSAHDPWFSTTAPLATLLFLLAVAVPFAWQVSQQRSHRLLGTLHQYLARPVVAALLRSNVQNPLLPQRVLVTTLIADMQNYTGQVESLSIEEATELTRMFLGCLTRPVLAAQGTLDKYTGDGLVAFWGAPLKQPQQADLALDAAKSILAEIFAYNVLRMNQGLPPLRVRIGIESGMAMVGDFGTAVRSFYTAVGDSINTAARLEQLARKLPHDVMIGPRTAAGSVRHALLCLGEVLLRGKEAPTMLYTFTPAASIASIASISTTASTASAVQGPGL